MQIEIFHFYYLTKCKKTVKENLVGQQYKNNSDANNTFERVIGGTKSNIVMHVMT